MLTSLSCLRQAIKVSSNSTAQSPFRNFRPVSTKSAITRGIRKSGRELRNPYVKDYGSPVSARASAHNRESFSNFRRGPIETRFGRDRKHGPPTYEAKQATHLKRAQTKSSRYEGKQAKYQERGSQRSSRLEEKDVRYRVTGTEKPPEQLRRSDNERYRQRKEGLGTSRETERRFSWKAQEPESGQHDSSPKDLSKQRRSQSAPLTIPYTTPASEFLYGTSPILAALKTRRRKLYKLYIYSGDSQDATTAKRDESLANQARRLGVEVVKATANWRDWIPMLDKMSGGRPHNGYVLEVSPLPRKPVTALQTIEGRQKKFEVLLAHQSREEEAVNGAETNIPYETSFARYPFILMLDGILDPGNLGAILRTAYFLGVDAIAISTHSAPLGPVAIKASAGAAEAIPLLSIHQTGPFMKMSKQNGWKFYAAVAPPNGRLPSSRAQGHFFSTNLTKHKHPLQEHPCVLMLGGEGAGLRPDLQQKADFLISIDGHRKGHGGVDSLNVSVAGGILCDAFLRMPTNQVSNVNLPREEDQEAEVEYEPLRAPKHSVRVEGDIF